ncbi:tagatose-bisphosphate aldolase [Kaistia algarum]|uniref:class II D-tagatose-bisphosphate aldolase, non-catalytic subunit n=1 Tax=Kaistia algarum TaxID=2083279 RepID=UPI000CE84433|nr:class II D-tagatose-bisphosphate aldolase, non-catalytic subunit [Kaistia algarum]MCX5514046.1 class II D-tagatose-bisphosphate aldolase, non-catalytic subunit [Kaistia algarum]PPE77784.1 tagatose-bisphosphate aldolase [Kaistia algarum]
MRTLLDIVAANRAGERTGIPSYCTAHPETLRAIFAAYRDDDAPILIEATCNQVNQFGGYTGMTPADFRRFAEGLAADEGVDADRLILGGDHLGPNPWKNEPAAIAMEKAKAMVAAFVEAGFTKIHLDASMACADDGQLAEATMAERAADLAIVAERAAASRQLAYVVGTEVPIPGGETETLDALAVTTTTSVQRTIDLHRTAFAARGLDAAFDRVVGIVVQPGVDFGNDKVYAFVPEKAADLSATVASLPGLVFEAHSSDYQTEAALAALVDGHFAILKVGPELTFAYRQAVVALAGIEASLGPAEPSGILDVIRTEMRAAPKDWRGYVAADEREAAMMLFGLSDRVRYYWPNPRIQAALGRLHRNIAEGRPEPGLVAQATGGLVGPAIDPAGLPRQLVRQMVGAVVAKYRAAARDGGAG